MTWQTTFDLTMTADRNQPCPQQTVNGSSGFGGVGPVSAHCCPWRKMEAAIGANHQNGGSGPSIFDFVFSACQAGVQRLLPLKVGFPTSAVGQLQSQGNADYTLDICQLLTALLPLD
jgi:hypothetical protein